MGSLPCVLVFVDPILSCLILSIYSIRLGCPTGVVNFWPVTSSLAATLPIPLMAEGQGLKALPSGSWVLPLLLGVAWQEGTRLPMLQGGLPLQHVRSSGRCCLRSWGELDCICNKEGGLAWEEGWPL